MNCYIVNKRGNYIGKTIENLNAKFVFLETLQESFT